MKKILSFFLAVILALSVCVFAASAENAEINGANWMSAIDASTPITAINMPGTHDTLTRYAPLSIIARTQKMSVSEQLYSGVRYLDIRSRIVNNEVIGVHGVTNCKESYGLFSKNLTLRSVVESCKNFLRENSGETILFMLKHENANDKTELFSKFYDDCIAPSKESWFLENRVPTLGEARGKIVLLRVAAADSSRFNDENSGINFEEYPYISSKEMNKFELRPVCEQDGVAHSFMYVQDSYRIEGEKKNQTIKNFFDEPLNSSNFNICCTNSTGMNPPAINAKKTNAFLMSYDFSKGKTYGFILMDFVTSELCEKIYMTNEPLMTNSPNQSQIPTSFSESYGFMGKFLKNLRDFILKLFFTFSV